MPKGLHWTIPDISPIETALHMEYVPFPLMVVYSIIVAGFCLAPYSKKKLLIYIYTVWFLIAVESCIYITKL